MVKSSTFDPQGHRPTRQSSRKPDTAAPLRSDRPTCTVALPRAAARRHFPVCFLKRFIPPPALRPPTGPPPCASSANRNPDSSVVPPPGRMLLLKQDILQSSPCIPRLIPASSNRREPAQGTRVRVPLARFQRLGFWLCAPVSRQPQEFGIPRLRIKTCGRDNGAQTEPRV